MVKREIFMSSTKAKNKNNNKKTNIILRRCEQKSTEYSLVIEQTM